MVHIEMVAAVESFSSTETLDSIPGTWSPGDCAISILPAKESYCTSRPPCSLDIPPAAELCKDRRVRLLLPRRKSWRLCYDGVEMVGILRKELRDRMKTERLMRFGTSVRETLIELTTYVRAPLI